MFVYVYQTVARKYEVLPENVIKDFECENENGSQSAQFSSRIFKCQKRSGKVTDCRILMVAKTKEHLVGLLALSRPRVPQTTPAISLTQNEPSQCSQTSANAPFIRKNLRDRSKNGILVTDVEIIKRSQSPSLITNNNTSFSDPSTSYGRSENSSSKMVSDDDSSENEDEYQPMENNNTPNVKKLKGDLRALREMFIEAEERSKRFLKINDQLMQDNEVLKQRVRELENQRTLSEQCANERPRSIITPAAMVQPHASTESNTIAQADVRRPEVLPIFISMNSGVYARRDGVEKAYEQHEPSKFYIKMCRATWSTRELADRCVKKEKRTNEKKVLTPKRKRVIRAHFQKFMKDLQYPPLLQQIYTSSINIYAHRAISTANSYNRRNNEDEMESADEDIEMVEL